ncbi:SDR family NAD(P)-dependent oxidoreductase [Flavobacterium sp.]|uniref:SDR family NAD(P)-dependent oxidoreductase n=1 Tax=Flavobacterium sp. TaxID=239 RepID=UPI0039E5B340
MKPFVVITGASQGLGKSFATINAQQDRNLILISLPGEGIDSVASQLKNQFDIEIICFETDLTQTENLYGVTGELQNYPIDMLINNAGIGGTQAFEAVGVGYIDAIVALNMRSVVFLTHQLLPKLREQKEAFILNISSLAAFSPMPFKTVYPASKAFVYSFSRGLNEELKYSGVHVAVAHPGGMPTNKEVSKRILSYGKMLRKSILTADETAAICMEKLLQKEAIIIPGRMNRIGSLLQKWIPVDWQLPMMRHKLEREIQAI